MSSSAATDVYRFIKRGVLDGTFAPGERLREAHLVDLIGVSRTPIREALRRLHAEGVVEFTTNKGARVTAWSTEDVLDMFAVRLQVESMAARLAAERITEPELQRLEQLEQEMERTRQERGSDASEAHGELNNAFHQAVVEAARSSVLSSTLSSHITLRTDGNDHPDSQGRMLLGQRANQQYSTVELERASSHHREIIAALRAGDPDWAASIVSTHILASRAVFRLRTRSSLTAE